MILLCYCRLPVAVISVPVMLGKMAGCKRNWAQSSTWTKQELGTILWAIDENMGTNLQALYSSSAVWKHKNINYNICKKNYYFKIWTALYKSGSAQYSKGRAQDSKGRAQDSKGRAQDSKSRAQDSKGKVDYVCFSILMTFMWRDVARHSHSHLVAERNNWGRAS